MVTDSLVRKKFVHDTLQKGLLKIYATQESVVRSNYQLRSGRLITLLSKHSFESSITSDSHTIFVRILPYLRFLVGATASLSSNDATLLFTIV